MPSKSHAWSWLHAHADPTTGEEVRGLCSNYLADVKPGDELVMTGPAGTALLLADNPWQKRIVCVSTGVLGRHRPSQLAGVGCHSHKGSSWCCSRILSNSLLLTLATYPTRATGGVARRACAEGGHSLTDVRHVLPSRYRHRPLPLLLAEDLF